VSRAICKKCGVVVFWSARRGIRLADYKHRDLRGRTETECDGELAAYKESTMLQEDGTTGFKKGGAMKGKLIAVLCLFPLLAFSAIIGNFADDFETASTNGSTGTLTWDGGWALKGEAKILTLDGNYQGAILANKKTSIPSSYIRNFTTPVGTVAVVFEYAYTLSVGTEGIYRSQFSTNNGVSWVVLATHSIPTTRTVMSFTNEIAAETTVTFCIDRLPIVKASRWFSFDDVDIATFDSAAAKAKIVKLEMGDGGLWIQLDSPSTPNESYVVYAKGTMDSPWSPVTSMVATASETKVFVSIPQGSLSGFFKVE